MKKQKTSLKKLSLDKNLISRLSNQSMQHILGGDGTGSTITVCGSKCGGASSYGVIGCSSDYGTKCK